MPLKQLDRADEYLALLEERVPKRTVSHSVSVATFMHSFVNGLGVTAEQALTAGLLHDLCKGLSRAELMAEANKYGVELNGQPSPRRSLLHGPVAAEVCRHELGIEDDAVCEAIRWHTTGKPDLGPVGLSLYLADFAEPHRQHPEAREARAILHRDGHTRLER